MAAEAIGNKLAPGILNLRSLNSYVSTAVADWRKVAAPVPLLSRQTGPNYGSVSPCTAGASSFGMSGVNAHVLLGSQSISKAAEGSKKPWMRSRYCKGIFFSILCAQESSWLNQSLAQAKY